jgi:hypothetical protein
MLGERRSEHGVQLPSCVVVRMEFQSLESGSRRRRRRRPVRLRGATVTSKPFCRVSFFKLPQAQEEPPKPLSRSRCVRKR